MRKAPLQTSVGRFEEKSRKSDNVRKSLQKTMKTLRAALDEYLK